MIDLLNINGFLDPGTRGEIVAEMAEAIGDAAMVYGSSESGRVDPAVRSVTKVAISESSASKVRELLTLWMDELSEYFGVQLSSFEEPQFLRYSIGDHFVAHQDGNTPLVYDDTRFRKVSIVVFLNGRSGPDAYSGGSLVFHGAFPDYDERRSVPCVPGTLAAFRSETTHEVTPVTAGQRFTIVSWYR